MKINIYKRISAFLMTIAVLLSSFSFCVLAEDNADSGGGSTGNAGKDTGCYSEGHFLWKVSLYVGKSDQVSTSSDISNFYFVGNQSVYVRPPSCTDYATAKYGAYNKIQYLNGQGLAYLSNTLWVVDSSCPLIPQVYTAGNINTVKSYFGSTGTLEKILAKIASAKNTTSYGLVSNLSITIGGTTKSGWRSDWLLPSSSMTNRIAWVVIYEPVVIAYLRDGTKVAFTATEFALAQLNGLYNFCNKSDNPNLTPQYLKRLTRILIPASVKLEESWFGYQTYNSGYNEVWNDSMIYAAGGWGMRFLPVSIKETPVKKPEYSVKNMREVEVDNNNIANVVVYWGNLGDINQTVLCEILVDGSVVKRAYINMNTTVKLRSYKIQIYGTSTKTITARINWTNRYGEWRSDNNSMSKQAVPNNTLDTTYDFSLYNLSVSPGEIYQGNSITVSFTTKNMNKDVPYNNIPIEILVDGVVYKSINVNYSSNQSINHSYPITIDKYGNRTITARVNWKKRTLESNSTNNSLSVSKMVNKYYDFSVSDLTITPSTVYEGGTITVTCRTDNWDEYNAYNNIPIELVYNGKVLDTLYVSYVPYGACVHTFTVNVGGTIGTNNIEVRVNYPNRMLEVNPVNNAVASVNTVKQNIDISIEPVIPNSTYNEGTEVITTYYVNNPNAGNIIPSKGNTVSFEVYYIVNGIKKVITTARKENVVIPAYGNNIVYFKWAVPKGLSGKTFYCKATVNADNSISESNTSNNSATLTGIVTKVTYMETPDTKFEERPTYWNLEKPLPSRNNHSTWSEWIYENGSFKKVTYGISVSAGEVELTPDINAFSSYQKYNKWYMRSGYGYSIKCTPTVNSLSGYAMPSNNAYTVAQNGNVLFPDFEYEFAEDKYRTLENVNGVLQFYNNPHSVDDYRIHFTPLWFPDGKYIASCKVYDAWTPVGMISATGNGSVQIKGSCYNDWYVSHR